MLLRSLFTGRAFIPHLVEGWGILPDTYVKAAAATITN
jgi:hypothetical protein